MSKDWDGEKAKTREQKSLTDFDPPKPDSDKQTTDLETDGRKVVSADDLPIQNLSKHQEKLEEEMPEVSIALVPPPEVLAATPVTDGGKTRGHCRRKQWRTDRTRTEITKRRRRTCHIHWYAK